MSALIQHSNLTDPELHEPKGASTAASGQVLTADGVGGSNWTTPIPPVVDHGALTGLTDDDHPQYLTTGRLVTYLDRHHFQETTDANNNTTTLIDYINQSFVLQHAATYRVWLNYVWSLNSAGTDFVCDLLVNSSSIVDRVVAEPQDTAGIGPYGTNQRYVRTLEGVYVNTVPGSTISFQFQFAASTVNDNAAIYRANLFVERWL